jgi:hypothetical protein
MRDAIHMAKEELRILGILDDVKNEISISRLIQIGQLLIYNETLQRVRFIDVRELDYISDGVLPCSATIQISQEEAFVSYSMLRWYDERWSPEQK